MRLILKELKSYDHLRGSKLPSRELKFEDIWAIGLFTTDGDLCSEFQKNKRDKRSGCKWSQFEGCLHIGLQILRFIQKMGFIYRVL